MKSKAPSVPKWWKNTYFWIAGLLFIVAIIGLPFVGGDRAIRDPGQLPEGGLVLIYIGGAGIMFVNGWVSHKQSLLHYDEEVQKHEDEE